MVHIVGHTIGITDRSIIPMPLIEHGLVTEPQGIEERQRIIASVGVEVRTGVNSQRIGGEKPHKAGVIGAVQSQIEIVAGINHAIRAQPGEGQSGCAGAPPQLSKGFVEKLVRNMSAGIGKRQYVSEFVGVRVIDRAARFHLGQQSIVRPDEISERIAGAVRLHQRTFERIGVVPGEAGLHPVVVQAGQIAEGIVRKLNHG